MPASARMFFGTPGNAMKRSADRAPGAILISAKARAAKIKGGDRKGIKDALLRAKEAIDRAIAMVTP